MACDVALGDIDGDGNLDIAVIVAAVRPGNPVLDPVALVRNKGDGSVETVTDWKASPAMTGLSAHPLSARLTKKHAQLSPGVVAGFVSRVLLLA